MEAKIIEMAALGRALHPGMLYDCRSDSVIPGISLWDTETIKKGVVSRRQPKTDLKFTASDCLSEKAKLLDVSASLTASILGGLVDVGGSARFLRDNKSSARQSRVSLQYSQTTRYEQFTMDRNITYPKVFEDGTATHVITAVLYGAQAFMVFDLTANEDENKEEIEGTLNVMVKNIPFIDIEGAGGLKMSDGEKKLSDKISCTFYGDYELEQNPTTYMEALQLYKELPSLLRKRENDAVPMKVWLYPLAHLSKKAATLEREIHKTLITKTETLLEDLRNAETQCNDLITNTTVNDFQDVRRRVKTLQALLEVYKVIFLKVLRRLIPAIRGGKEKEQALADIITIHQKSPFRVEKLNQWFENNQSELHLLNLYTQQLAGVPVVKYSALLSNILIDPSVDTVVCFSFTSLKYEDPYLSILTKFLKVDEFENLVTVPESAEQLWFHSPELSEKMKDNLFLFRSFFQANKDDKQIRFVIVSVSDPSNPGISIRLYKKGKMVDSAFKTVSKPPAPKVNIQDRNMILKLQKSPTGSTVRFRVEYRTIQATDSEADVEKWDVTETPDAQENFTLTGIKPANQYWVQYRAISEVGVSEASDSVLFSRQGKLKISLGQNWNWSHWSIINELRSQMLSNLCTSQWSPSNIQSEVKNLLNNPKLPFVVEIPGGMKPGMALCIQGVVSERDECFFFNHRTGTSGRDDIAFHLMLVPNFSFECNMYQDAKWGDAEIYPGCSLSKGSHFVLFIVISKEAYEVYLDGRRYCLFKHRIPVDKVKVLQAKGNVIINSVGVVSNWSASTFGKEQRSGISHWELSNIRSDVNYPLCKPDQPYSYPIPGGLKPGLALFFQGVVPLGSECFEINQKAGPHKHDENIFHFKTYLSCVVCDTFCNDEWEKQQLTEDPIFAEGEAFDIFMLTKQGSYDVIVNGRHLCTFKERIPMSKVAIIEISGNVFMNTFGIIQVDNANLTLDISALM
ncbi:cytolytic toxin-alpha-like [Pangasianodon hypophthalmus]|uniref:cytolytic toxin-alpha-like n=1 Tax=Pangasianodon hypophthalmus TaxID=310915 RepID=UPI002308020F|nr:cytolytic toxin-alpha-like [Pangasianodon hypophthalmus]